MALVTDKFRIYAAESFRDTLQSSNKVYMFVGRAKTWGSTDVPPVGEPIDSFEYARGVYQDSVAFKRVDISDTALVVPRVDWTDPTKTTGGVGRTYSMYKPDYAPAKTTANGASRLYDSNFYVMNSDFNVYKCLYNGQDPTYPRGRPSLVEPTGTSTTIIETSDSPGNYSYRWKYMYTIDADNILKFVTSEFIPVLSNALVKSAANPGSVDTVVIENAGAGYNNGTYTNVPVRGDYSINGGTQALCTVTVVSGSISAVTITQAGAGYSFASIDVALINNIGNGTGASLDVVLPPNAGHGADAVRELGAYRLMFTSKLETTSAFVDFPNDLTYRRVGIVLNPYDYNTTTICSQNTRSAVKAMIFPQSGTGTPSGNFAPGESITQASTGAKGFVVSYNATTKVLKYYQDSADGVVAGNIVAFSGSNQITSSQNAYTATPDATFGTSQVPLSQITIGVSVYELGLSFTTGYANEEIELNSGELLYIDNRIPITRSADQNEELKVVIEF
ncbi:MAG: hypothetical protein CMA59_00035 [Euryarchaeota archaeon]|nr:hypothetical protein [Euryarchaeota archaeon]